MTLHDYYRRAALAKRALDRANARVDQIGQIFWRGIRPDILKRWSIAAAHATVVARERLCAFEVARSEARDRMLFDPREEAERREIARFIEDRKRLS